MRTTVSLDDQLHQQSKIAAAASGWTLSKFIEEALRETILRRAASAGRERVTLPTFKGQGLRPGVNLENWAALLDLMEETQADDSGRT